MNLFLLRHGIAEERDTPGFQNDFARPLTAKGKRQLRQTCAAMRKMKIDFDLILASPLVRAKQTAKIAAKELERQRRLEFSDALKPGGDAKKLVQKIYAHKPAAASVLLVGHEPDLSRLVSLLVSGKLDLSLDFKKGGLAKLEAAKLRAGKCATLAWLLTPKQMKLMT